MPEDNKVIETTETVETDNKPVEEPKKDEPTTQELLNQIATLKRSLDKATAEAAENKRKYRETLSATEKASMEKAEAEAKEAERVKGLERQVALYGLEKQFARLGYSPDDAQKAAAYQYDGDTDSLFKLQEGIQRAREAELRKSIEADIYKNIPDPKQGTGAQDDDLFLKGFNSVKSPYSR